MLSYAKPNASTHHLTRLVVKEDNDKRVIGSPKI